MVDAGTQNWLSEGQAPVGREARPVALIDFGEGVRVVANLRDIEPETVRIDRPAPVDFVEVGQDFVVPVIRERRAG